MEKSLKFGLLFALTVMVLSGCNKNADILFDNTNENNGRTHVISTENKEWFIDLKEAQSLSDQFLDWKQGVEMRSSEKDKILKNTSVIKSKRKSKNGRTGNDTLMYIFNYTKGFAIVSATKEVYPILAYSDEGFFDENDSTNLGPIIWLDYMKKDIENIMEDTTKNTDILNVYNSLSFSGNEETDVLLRAAIYINEIRNYKKVGPLLTTEWHQGYPYDYYNCTLFPSGRKAPSGCVPVAIAQVVNYYKILSGINIDWTAIGNGNCDAISYLINVIGGYIGMTYTEEYAYPNLCFPNIFCYRDRIVNYLKDRGYNAAFVDLGSQNPVVCPAIYEGFTENFIGSTNWFGGHWWVMDGYESYDVYRGWFEEKLDSPPQFQKIGPQVGVQPGESTCYSVLLLHFNWGQENTKSNGWYGVNNSYTYINGKGDKTVYEQSFKRLNISKK
jgi:hypothetical protein